MRIAAFLIALAIATIAVDRPLFCADGCDRNDVAAQHGTHVPCGGCATCQTVAMALTEIETSCPSVSAAVFPTPHGRPASHTSNDIDHPPRTH
ncbi:MAG TPA: hypothetical protein VH458_24550 [Vicinamibacterales bacterium]